MTRTVIFAIPGDLETRTGGYGYDRRLLAELEALGWTVRHLELPAGFPHPSEDEIAAATRLFGDIEDGSTVLVDGMAYSVLPALFEAEAKRLDVVALIHHPLSLETGLSVERAETLAEEERQALRFARSIIVTSPETARILRRDFGVASDQITVALPGTDKQPIRSRQADVPAILSVGTLIPRKGHDILIEALCSLKELSWTCRIIGGGDSDPAHAAELKVKISRAGLDDRIVLAGSVDGLENEYASADIFALATLYEGYGMVFAEALSHGLPIVGTTGGAVPDVVPQSAGLLVEPGDAAALAVALRRTIGDPELRADLSAGARMAAEALPEWRDSALVVDEVLREGGQ
ncbi:glycosyltransferase family 4 protein [Fulvimarina sp. MAC3]|uniref:glycosyltransferase family 4 protein n=1 Tax=Fulvimarina sp. MAC3 TaxID=3148887 RepID=UPI0031FCB6E9